MTATEIATPRHHRNESHGGPAGGGTNRADDQVRADTHQPNVVGAPSPHLDQGRTGTDGISVGVGDSSTTPDQQAAASHTLSVGGGDPAQPGTHTRSEFHDLSGSWLELRIWAEMFYDAQQQRIATDNRAKRGGVNPDIYAAYTDALTTAERVVRLHMIHCYRRTVPASIQAWVKASRGIGEPAMARLLGHLGHPRIATPHHWEGSGSERTLVAGEPYPRTIAQLWQYCGHGAPGRPAKGMTAGDLAALGNPQLKMIVHIISQAAMKLAEGPYRSVYEQARADYAERLHSTPCVRCGPSGKPKAEGTPWNLGHQHAAALRKVGKEILRDLWIVAGQDGAS